MDWLQAIALPRIPVHARNSVNRPFESERLGRKTPQFCNSSINLLPQNPPRQNRPPSANKAIALAPGAAAFTRSACLAYPLAHPMLDPAPPASP